MQPDKKQGEFNKYEISESLNKVVSMLLLSALFNYKKETLN